MNAKNMISKMSSIRLSLTVAAGLAATVISSHAQSASGTISGISIGTSSFAYKITLTNTGAVALKSFWYAWTTGGDNLAATPSGAGNSLGWGNSVDGKSIQWVNSTGTPLAPGATATFTFVSASSPTTITKSPSGESVAYVGTIDFSQGKAGDSTPVFSPVLISSTNAEVDASATISGVAAGNTYNYAITLLNTGYKPLNSFWYAWTITGDNLPTDPTSAGNSMGWVNQLSANSIMWINSSGTSLQPGNSTVFTFVSTDTPTAITTPPSGESVAYIGGIDCSQDVPGDSTDVFSPALISTVSGPPPVLGAGVSVIGSGAIVLTWPATNSGFTLQSTTSLDAPMVWTTVTPAPVVVNGQNTVTNIITGAQQFFRLANP